MGLSGRSDRAIIGDEWARASLQWLKQDMHLSAAAVENAIRLLDQLLLPTDSEIVETMNEPACK